MTEEITKDYISDGFKSYTSEFSETLRFLPNETGTIQMFITGQGNLS